MRRTPVRVIGILLALMACLVVAACGGSSIGARSGGTSTVPSNGCAVGVASTAGKGRPSGHVWHAERVVPVSTLPPGVTPGQVQLAVEGTAFGSCDVIPLWAGNGLSSTIYTTDHHSDCSIVTLQRQVNGAWQPVADCLLASATQIVPVASMQAVFVQLKPSTVGAQSGPWPSGTYRAIFSYSLVSNDLAQQTEVDSASFTISQPS